MFNPYQQYQPMPNYPQYNQQPMQPRQELIRVNGLDGAKAYNQLGANSQVALFDGNDDIFYIKCTDGAGFPTIKTYRFQEVTQTAPERVDYVTRQEFEELKEAINGKFTIPKSSKSADATADK